MTNLEFIRQADENELALRLMCPYDIEGCKFEELPCSIDESKQSKEGCHKCVLDWLHSEREVKE